ncbi:hypothetical protein AAMO2058_000433700 [Amorphochlora amoebiformis]
MSNNMTLAERFSLLEGKFDRWLAEIQSREEPVHSSSYVPRVSFARSRSEESKRSEGNVKVCCRIPKNYIVPDLEAVLRDEEEGNQKSINHQRIRVKKKRKKKKTHTEKDPNGASYAASLRPNKRDNSSVGGQDHGHGRVDEHERGLDSGRGRGFTGMKDMPRERSGEDILSTTIGCRNIGDIKLVR